MDNHLFGVMMIDLRVKSRYAYHTESRYMVTVVYDLGR